MRDFISQGYNRIQSVGTQSVTGTTNQTVLSSVVVPANTFTTGDFVYLDSMLSKTGTAGAFTFRFYWVQGTTATLTGATALSTRTGISTVQYATHVRKLYIRTATSTGTGLTQSTELAVSPSTDVFDDWRTGVRTSVGINWTVDNTFFITAQLVNTGDIARSYYIKFWEW